MSAFLFYAVLPLPISLFFPCYFIFCANVAPEGVMLSPDISEYLDFTIKLLLMFGCLFEIPMVMVLLVSLK